MRKRPSILSVYRICVSRPCQHSRPYTTSVIFLLHVRPLLHIRPILTGLKLLPQHPRCVNVARNVARGVSRGVGRMRQYEHLTGAGSQPLFYISHNLSVEIGNFTDKLFILNHLSVRTCLFTDKPIIFGVNPCQDYARLSVSR